MMCVVTLIVEPWFNKKTFFNIIAFIVPIVYAINLIYFKTNVLAFIGLTEDTGLNVREIEFGIECILAISIGLNYLARKIITKDFTYGMRQVWQTALTALVLVFLTMPCSTLYNLFGGKLPCPKDFVYTHKILLIWVVVLIVGIYFLYRKKSYKDKYSLLTIGAIITFIQFFSYYAVPFGVGDLPLHLCHTAVILMLFSFIFKIKSVFYFNYFVNVLGAIVALLLPDNSAAFTMEMTFHFWFEHIALVVIPILAVALGVFPRPNMKSIVSCLLVFTGYFLVVAFLNSWLVNYDANVNYFFMNSDKLVNMFTWTYKIKYDNILVLTKGDLKFTLYPLFWALMYGGFIILVLAQWAVYFASYRIADDYHKLLLIKKMKGFKMFNIKKLTEKQKNVKPMYPSDNGLIRISHFTKIYEGSSVKAVDDFSLTVKGGEVYGFLGHNGAGKSTTIKSLVGIQTITDGVMSVCGFDVAKQPVEAKRNIGYVSDNHAVYEKLTGREYINYVADLYLVPEKERNERFNRYVTMFNLTDAIDKEIKGYSHGMKQKIVVIASLMHDPKIWVLDEPLTGLDPTSSFQIKECMREHANRGNIVFFSSHVIEVVEKICDKICIIGHGKLIGEWNIKQLNEEGITLEELYMKYVSTQNLVTATDTLT